MNRALFLLEQAVEGVGGGEEEDEEEEEAKVAMLWTVQQEALLQATMTEMYSMILCRIDKACMSKSRRF